MSLDLATHPRWRIEGPRELYRVSTKEAYVLLHQSQCANHGREPWNAGSATPEINWGRWVFECDICRSGVLPSVEWDCGLCFGCGGIYHTLKWPPERYAIEEAVALRPKRENQNWLSHETLNDVLAENAARGVPD